MLAKLKLPPGFYKNGTNYLAVGRYAGGNLVRWYNGIARSIGGWAKRFDYGTQSDVPPLFAAPSAEKIRSAVSIGGVGVSLNTYLGSNLNVYMVSDSNSVTEITPAAFTPQPIGVSTVSGYGRYRYGRLAYGTPRPITQSSPQRAFTWRLDAWGSELIACAREQGGDNIYKFQVATDTILTPITGTPEGANDCLVTDERFLMIFGNTEDSRTVYWSDRENYDDWDFTTATNQAGFYRLSGTGKLIRGVKALGRTFILGENDAFVATYIGPPYVYSFDRVGRKCGIVAAEAVAFTDKFIIWLGAAGFWLFDGTLANIPCEVWDFFVSDANPTQISKTVAGTSAEFHEVWFHYQSNNSAYNDVDSYIVFNYAEKVWYTGRLNRTVHYDKYPLQHVLMVDEIGTLYDHELLVTGKDDQLSYLETGPLELENGERLMGISYIYPDEKFEGDISLEIFGKDMPNMPERLVRNFTMNSPISTTGVMARQLRFKFTETSSASRWAMGDFRIEAPKNLSRR